MTPRGEPIRRAGFKAQKEPSINCVRGGALFSASLVFESMEPAEMKFVCAIESEIHPPGRKSRLSLIVC